MSILRLAIPAPLRCTFDYLPPANMSSEEIASLRPGQRLRVPFGQREVAGYLLGVEEGCATDATTLKSALSILDHTPLITHNIYRLCLWAAEYYHHPLGEVLQAAFPKRLRTGGAHQPLGEPAWRLTVAGRGLPNGALQRTPRQAQALALLQANADALSTSELQAAGISSAVMRALKERGLAEKCVLKPPARAAQCTTELTLNAEQSAALTGLLSAGDTFSCHLLEGVTGSGKTEVYLQWIADCLRRGRQALVLIPEIGLTPQTLDRFRQRFDANIAVFHSGLGEAERYRAWEAARDGTAHIVIGTRSAIFTPLQRIGLIIVDEEHDSSYKQQDGFRYSARDVAVKRAQVEDCPVLLGSATPSLESVHNAVSGRYQLHRLQQRAGGANMPELLSVDVRRSELRAGLSSELLAAMHQSLQLGQQILLFLNRRGYAPTLLCHDCGWIANCRDCDTRLTVHRRQRRLRCHHCAASHRMPQQCPQCHSTNLLAAGLGTEQTEEFLRDHFQRWPVYRVDSDSMRGREAMATLVATVKKGDPCILLGTQMLTKGHHFPMVGLVAVVDADAMLFSADFRGEERMAQLITQVAGRAGRAGQPGKVMVQTHYPEHPVLRAMLTSTFADQARDMLSRRQASGMPPCGQLVMVRSDCAAADKGEAFLRILRAKTEAQLPDDTFLIGPLPSPLPRRAGKYRHQLVLAAAQRRTAQCGATLLVQNAETIPTRGGVKWSIDIDPTEGF